METSSNRRLTVALCIVFVLCALPAWAQQPDPPGQAKDGKAVNEAYLFAHMMHSDYGRLYYAVSLDGLHWTQLNDGRRVFNGYRGHADICRGRSGM